MRAYRYTVGSRNILLTRVGEGESERYLLIRERESMSKWTVWVGGSEVNSYYLDKDQSESIAQAWKDKGYDDVIVEEVK